MLRQQCYADHKLQIRYDTNYNKALMLLCTRATNDEKLTAQLQGNLRLRSSLLYEKVSTLYNRLQENRMDNFL